VPVVLRVEGGPHRGVPRAEVRRRIRAMFDGLQLGDAELSIVLTGDKQIRKLNAQFRDVDAPTDVLAFAMREGEGEGLDEGLLGDVVVSVERARIQAARAGHDLLSEVTMLLAHGLLHLLGWDHETRAKDARMRAETARLCSMAAGKVKAPPGRRRGAKVRGRPTLPLE
jgi:probable rRNA maturation factor